MTILSVTRASDDQVAFRDCLADVRYRILAANTCRDAMKVLKRGGISIVVCEDKLPDGTWRDILDSVLSLTGRPILIVTSSCADERLWAEVLNLGGFDLVNKPFNRKELRHVLNIAGEASALVSRV
jgi:DNA-binding response OmpR family regulator